MPFGALRYLTTLTTVLGLLPLALGVGAGAELQAALARVVIGGLIASTMITLVLIPVVYLTVANLMTRFDAWKARVFGRAQVESSPDAELQRS